RAEQCGSGIARAAAIRHALSHRRSLARTDPSQVLRGVRTVQTVELMKTRARVYQLNTTSPSGSLPFQLRQTRYLMASASTNDDPPPPPPPASSSSLEGLDPAPPPPPP